MGPIRAVQTVNAATSELTQHLSGFLHLLPPRSIATLWCKPRGSRGEVKKNSAFILLPCFAFTLPALKGLGCFLFQRIQLRLSTSHPLDLCSTVNSPSAPAGLSAAYLHCIKLVLKNKATLALTRTGHSYC